MSLSFSNNIGSFNQTNINFTVTDDQPNILAWLSPLDPKIYHQAIQGRRVQYVGEWLLQTEQFRSWYAISEEGESDNPVLFCYGDPGVGKTYISSLVIDYLGDRAGWRGATVACFYFDFAAQKEQSPVNMLGSLLKQLISGQEEIPEEISRAYQGQRNVIGGRGPQPSDILKMLQTTSSEIPTFICIDALDECIAGNRMKLLDSLNQILQNSPGTRIFMTGRPHILPEIGRRLPGRITSISISPKRYDIITFLDARLAEDTTPDAMDSTLEADILKKIPDDVSEIFLLVSLNIDAILQETTIHRRRQKLRGITDVLQLGDAYGATLGRIKGQGREKARLGMAALMWISHSERPLKANELCHALSVEIGSPDFNSDNVPSIETVLACCQGLIAVDKGAFTVRLIHLTLLEYFQTQPDLFSGAHSAMAETCLSYLNSQQVKALSTSPSPDRRGMPFLEYSSLYWGMHARRDLSHCAKLLALKLFGDYNNHISTKILLKADRSYTLLVNFDRLSLFSGLHCASMFGIIEIVTSLVDLRSCDMDREDCVGNTPLLWAAFNGHEEVVRILLRWGGANPNKQGIYGQTPLFCAARRGHEGVVKILLERDDVDPDKPDVGGQTPLCYAASNGNEGMVKMLLGRSDVNPNKPGESGRAPLSCAARSGHEGVVKILLERDSINPDKPDNAGELPLYCATRSGHEGVVRMLLEREDANLHGSDSFSQTLLCCAIENGHEGVVKILLERDVNLDKPCNHGQTPLFCSVLNGHEGVTKILLRRDDTDPNKLDKHGRTPLCWAAQHGRAGAVKVLLERDDVDPNIPCAYGRTPLCFAAWNGHVGVVIMLLGRDDVDVDKPDNNGQTPLWWAIQRRNIEIVALLQPL